ncbi:MAG TPA: hypothetical protein VL523_02540 [Terriglobia bacterium]|nr:hypothetical protein [Terriglobia bacterium]
MKMRIPVQLIVGVGIVFIGGGALLGELLLVKWYPLHQKNVADAARKLLPYQNADLGIDMQVAAGIYGKVESVPDGVRIYRPKFFGKGPSLTIVSQTNPDGATEFSPEVLAHWQADGVNQGIPRYSFQNTQIDGRNAALVWRFQGVAMIMTAHIISPTRVIQADCTPGVEDEATYLEACDETLHSIKLAGPPTPAQAPAEPTLEDLRPPKRIR